MSSKASWGKNNDISIWIVEHKYLQSHLTPTTWVSRKESNLIDCKETGALWLVLTPVLYEPSVPHVSFWPTMLAVIALPHKEMELLLPIALSSHLGFSVVLSFWSYDSLWRLSLALCIACYDGGGGAALLFWHIQDLGSSAGSHTGLDLENCKSHPPEA